MRIVQLLGRIEGSGVTRYTIELRNALIELGHTVDTYYFKNDFPVHTLMQTIDNIKEFDDPNEIIDELNSADIMLINTIISANASKEQRDTFYKLIRDVKGPVKALFCLDHFTRGFMKFYGKELYDDPDLVMKHIDKYVTFSPTNPVFGAIEKRYPEIRKKYVHLQLLYKYDDSKKYWKPFDKKYRRITYLGRAAQFKDPQRLVRHVDDFARYNFQAEMRGVTPTIKVSCVPDFKYEIVDGVRVGLSKKTYFMDTPLKVRRIFPDIDDVSLIHFTDRDLHKVHILGRYIREEGIDALSYSMFGCDFYYPTHKWQFGSTIEFCIAEIAESGTIPVLDYDCLDTTYLYVDGKKTDKTLLELDAGIALKRDGSNIDEVLARMDELATDEKKYVDYLNHCCEIFKMHFEPKGIAKQLIEDLLSDDNTESLNTYKEFPTSISLF